MSRNLDHLYQELILEHNKKPRNFSVMPNPSIIRHGRNPLCGDEYLVYLKMEDEHISDITFQGAGCAISKASASIMTTLIKGKTIAEARELKDCFLGMVTDKPPAKCAACLGSLKVFEGVKKFPARVKCAALIWRALEAALDGQLSGGHPPVSTE